MLLKLSTIVVSIFLEPTAKVNPIKKTRRTMTCTSAKVAQTKMKQTFKKQLILGTSKQEVLSFRKTLRIHLERLTAAETICSVEYSKCCAVGGSAPAKKVAANCAAHAAIVHNDNLQDGQCLKRCNR